MHPLNKNKNNSAKAKQHEGTVDFSQQLKKERERDLAFGTEKIKPKVM